MKGLFAGLLYIYEYIGFLFRTVLLFLVKILVLIIGILLFLLIGRKEIFIYAKKMDILNLPFKSNIDERFLNGIILSTTMSLFLLTHQYYNPIDLNNSIDIILNSLIYNIYLFLFCLFITQMPYFGLILIRKTIETFWTKD